MSPFYRHGGCISSSLAADCAAFVLPWNVTAVQIGRMTNKDCLFTRRRGRPSRDAEPVDRLALLRHALAAFATDGYEKASLRQIATLAGVSDSLLSYVFGSKDKLWFAVVDEVFGPLYQRYKSQMDQLALQPEVGASSFREALVMALKLVMAEPLMLAFLNREGEGQDERAQYLRQHYQQPFLERVEQLYRAACKELGHPPVSRATLYILLMGTCRFVASPGSLPDDMAAGIQHAEGLDAFLDQILDDLLPAAPSPHFFTDGVHQ